MNSRLISSTLLLNFKDQKASKGLFLLGFSETRKNPMGSIQPTKTSYMGQYFCIDLFPYISPKPLIIKDMGANIRPRFNRNDKTLEKDEKARISIGVYFTPKKRKFIPTDFFVTEDQWDAKKLRVNHKHDNQKYINAKIAETITKLEQYEYKLECNGKCLTVALLEDFTNWNYENSTNMTFNEFLAKQLKTRSFNTKSTFNVHQKTLNKFNSFRKDAHFHELTISFVEQFDEFMKGQGLMTNSRMNHHKTLKANLQIAAAEGFI